MFLVGVDAGGTGTRTRIIKPDGSFIGEGQAGPGNIATNFETASQNIISAVTQAFAHGGFEHVPYDQCYAALGIAGANLATYGNDYKVKAPFKTTRVESDGFTTFQGAIGSMDGNAAVIGTGSVFVSRHDEIIRYVGGWGYLLGDQGSGASLGMNLLRRVIECADGLRQHSDLTHDIYKQFNSSIVDIVAFASKAIPANLATFARDIVVAAQNDDKNAVALMRKETKGVRKSIDALGFKPGEALCLTGGLGPSYKTWLPDDYQNSIINPKGTALDGAISLARLDYEAATKPMK